jgi:hypothetical protein
MIIYLSGITSDTDLKEIERIKSHVMKLGCTIFIPEDKSFGQLSWAEDLQNRLGFLCNSNAIYMLPNWRDSIMARIELTAAMSDKIPACFSLDDIKELITTLDE